MLCKFKMFVFFLECSDRHMLGGTKGNTFEKRIALFHCRYVCMLVLFVCLQTCFKLHNDVLPHQSIEWSYEVYDTAVQRCCRDLTQFMNPSILLPTLVEAGHLTLEEAAEIIKSPAGHSDHCLLLLAKVARKGRGAYSALFQALKDDSQHKPHHELWETLVQKCEGTT